MSKVSLSFTLVLQSGKNKDKEVTKSEICQNCYDDLYGSIKSDFEVNNSFPLPQTENPKKIEITKGETIVPSNTDNIALPPQPKCYHDKKSFDEPYVTCRDCGEKWRA
jgi:hypothetical protein